jgi:hypothetical protein
MGSFTTMVQSTFKALFDSIKITNSLESVEGLNDALTMLPCLTKLFCMQGADDDNILSVYTHKNGRELCFLILSRTQKFTHSATRTSKELLHDRDTVIKSKTFRDAQKWTLFFESLAECVRTGSFWANEEVLTLIVNGEQIVIPLRKNTQFYDLELFFRMSDSARNENEELREKIAEQERQIAELTEKLEKKEEAQNGALSPDVQTKVDVPIQKVLQLLKRWKSGPLSNRRDSVDVDYIMKTIANDALYEVEANRERDLELRGWLDSEMNPNASSARATGRRWSIVRAYHKMLGFNNRGGSSRRKSNKGLEDLGFRHDILDHLLDSDSVDWDVFKLQEITNGRALYHTGLYLFHRHDLINKLRIPLVNLKAFLTEVEQGYRDNPYHNNIHACDVLQTLNVFLTKSEKARHLTDLDKFTALVAAMVHDYDHPGVTNNFERLCESDRALLYNDQSILENHHCTQAFRLLKKENCDITEGLSREEWRYCRDSIINLILSTDMSKHFAIVGTLQSTILNSWDPTNKEQLGNMLKMFLKCADVGNPAKNNRIARLWTERISQEFFNQGDLEREMDLPISPFMDREKANIPKSQTGFIDYIAKPMYECLCKFDPKLQEFLDNINGNREYWAEQERKQS